MPAPRWVQLLAGWGGCREPGSARRGWPLEAALLYGSMPLCRGRVGLSPLGEKVFFSFPAIGEVTGEGVLRDRGSFIFKAKRSCRPPIPAGEGSGVGVGL